MPYTKRFEDTLYNEKWLRHHYRGMRWTSERIARLIGCTPSAVLDRLRIFGIPVRSRSQAQHLASHPGSHAPRPKKCLDTLHDPEWLRKEYETKNASDIARELGISVPSVIWVLKKAGIARKTISEAKKGRALASGEAEFALAHLVLSVARRKIGWRSIIKIGTTRTM